MHITWQYAPGYADQLRQAGASSLLCQECILSVIAQLSNKSANHPSCAFAESASSVMSGVMVSLTPVFQPKTARPIQLSEYAEFEDADQMVTQLNEILSKPDGFPAIPAPRKECQILVFPENKRNDQYVICPEQECESLVYHADQSRSMIEVLGLDQDPFWEPRVKAFHSWYSKSGSKTSRDAWTWEGKDSQKLYTKGSYTKGFCERGQSVPANPADRQNPQEQGLRWKDIGEANLDESFLYPGQESDPPCPVRKQQYLSKDEQQQYMQWIENVLNIDRRTSEDPRLYCAYCDMNNHPRFACKHAYKHRIETEKHRCTLCSAFHAPFRCPRAQCNGGSGKPNWARIEYKGAKQESREPDLRWGSDAAQPLMESPVQESQQHQSPSEDQPPMCAATAMMHGIPSGAASSWQGAACPSIHERRQWAPQATESDVILPNPGCKADANIWHLNIRENAPFFQDQWHLSCAIAIPWRVLPIQAISLVVHSRWMTSKIFAKKPLWRTSSSSSAISKGFNSKPRVFDCGPMGSMIKSWMKLKGSIHT